MPRSGNLVKIVDGRYGIVFDDDMEKEFNGKKNSNPKLQKVLVTLTDENYNILHGEKKVLIPAHKLKHKGFID